MQFTLERFNMDLYVNLLNIEKRSNEIKICQFSPQNIDQKKKENKTKERSSPLFRNAKPSVYT